MWHSGHRMSAAASDKLVGNVEVKGARQAGLPRLAAAGNVSILSSTNDDSAVAAVATTQAPEEAADWFLQYTAIYIIPLWIVLGVLNNVSVLCVMPRKGVLVPKRMKRLYIGIAFGDLITILAQDLVYFYLEQGLYFTTNGAYWVRSKNSTEQYSTVQCRGSHMFRAAAGALRVDVQNRVSRVDDDRYGADIPDGVPGDRAHDRHHVAADREALPHRTRLALRAARRRAGAERDPRALRVSPRDDAATGERPGPLHRLERDCAGVPGGL